MTGDSRMPDENNFHNTANVSWPARVGYQVNRVTTDAVFQSEVGPVATPRR